MKNYHQLHLKYQLERQLSGIIIMSPKQVLQRFANTFAQVKPWCDNLPIIKDWVYLIKK